MTQKATSANTSINSKKLPRIYKISPTGFDGKTILDYGCGKYTDHIRKFAHDDMRCRAWFGYDPYNQPENVNKATRETLTARKADYGFLSNVLNVIDSEDGIVAACKDALTMAKRLVITVYQADGEPRYTQPDCWQWCKPREWYFDLLNRNGLIAIKGRKGCLVVYGPNWFKD